MRHDDRRGMRDERAFSLIEIIVASAVAVLVIGLALSWFLDAMHGTDRVGNRSTSSTQLDGAIAFLRKDVTAMRAADRSASAAYDPTDFATAIATGTPLRGYDDDGVTIRVLDVHDLITATPDELVFSASTAAGTTCVRWAVTPDGGLVRSQLGTAGSACSQAAPVRERRMFVRPAQGEPALAHPFAFVIARPLASGQQCRTALVSRAIGAAERGSVVAILVDLQARDGAPRTAAASGRQVRLDVSSRLAEDYQRALGCAP
ncbi:MAG: hypothetical protein JWN72_313 [Thermoleophilia bacterium]|nr:hypothetical protein [Thermoleophilia bacterium]